MIKWISKKSSNKKNNEKITIPLYRPYEKTWNVFWRIPFLFVIQPSGYFTIKYEDITKIEGNDRKLLINTENASVRVEGKELDALAWLLAKRRLVAIRQLPFAPYCFATKDETEISLIEFEKCDPTKD